MGLIRRAVGRRARGIDRRVEVTRAIREITAEFEPEIREREPRARTHGVPYALNCGWCVELVDELEQRFPTGMSCDTADAVLNPLDHRRLYLTLHESLGLYAEDHAWFYLQGLHFDAEAPHGVRDWRELPIFRRARQQWAKDIRTTFDDTWRLRTLAAAQKHGFKGTGGLCGAAAMAINVGLFVDQGQYVAAVNWPMWRRGHFLGHVAVRDARGVLWDAEGTFEGPDGLEEFRAWGMLDPENPDYKLTEEQAYDARIISLTRPQVQKLFDWDPDLTDLLLRARA